MIKILATVAVVGAMLAGGITTLPILPEKILTDNPTIHILYDNSNNFAFVNNGNANIVDGQTGETIKTWPIEGTIFKIKSDYCIFYNNLPENSRMYTLLPSGNQLLSRNEQERYLIFDGDGSYARLPNMTQKDESNTLTVYPEGKNPYTITIESPVYIGSSMAGKHNEYLYYLIGDNLDENALWLVICDFATGVEHFRVKSEPDIYKLSFSDDKVIFGKSVYDIPSKTKLFTAKEGMLEFFGKNYYTTAYDINNTIFTLLDPTGEPIKSRKVEIMSRYRMTRFYGGFIAEYDKEGKIALSDAFDESTPKIPITPKSGARFQPYPLGTKLLVMYGSELLCYDYDTKKLAWKKDFQRINYKYPWSLPVFITTGEDGSETLKAFDYKSEEYISLPEGYTSAIKGETVAWILPQKTKPEQPWPLLYKDGKTTPATGESSNGTIITAYAWKDSLVVCFLINNDDTNVTKPVYEYVGIKDNKKTILYQATENISYNATFNKNHCTFGSGTMIIDINIETMEKKETTLVKPTKEVFSYFPWQDGYLCKLKGSMGFIQNGKTTRTFKGYYVHHDEKYLWTSYNPGTTEVDDEGNTYAYTELAKYNANGAKAESVIFKNNGNIPSRLNESLYYLGNTIIDNDGGRIQTIQNFETTAIYGPMIRFFPDSSYTSIPDYASMTSSLIKWAPCATYTATVSDGKLVIKNNSENPSKIISGQIILAFVGTGEATELIKLESKRENVENLAVGEDISFETGTAPEGKKLVFIAELNGVLDIGADPSNDFKKNHDRYIGVPMTKKIGFARVIRIVE